MEGKIKRWGPLGDFDEIPPNRVAIFLEWETRGDS
jgi:hypothetical protein